MRKVLITLALLTGLSSSAQGGGHHEHRKEGATALTSEQVATLMTKKMALALDLDKKQQEEVLEIHLEEAQFRRTMKEKRSEKEERTKPSAEDRFVFKNELLDRKLEKQQKLKQILDEDQYAQWKKISHRKHTSSKRNMRHTHRSE